MRGSGAKGIPRTPKGHRKYETREDHTTPLATNGWFRFWYASTHNSYGGGITFVEHSPLQGDTTYVFDLGRPCMVGGIGCGTFLEFAVQWSHDGVRWYEHYSDTLVEKWADEDDGADLILDTPGSALLWLKPVPRARYWKIIYPTPQEINPSRTFSFFIYEERNPSVLYDHNDANYLQLSTSQYGTHTPRAINRSRSFDFGVAPEFLWLMSHEFTEFNFRFYLPAANKVRMVDLLSSTRDGKQQIVQATKRGYTVGRPLWDRNVLWFVPEWHINHVWYSGATTSYEALAFRTNREKGVAVAVGRPDSLRLYHGFGHIPDIVLFGHVSKFQISMDVDSSPYFLSKDFPNLYFTPDLGANDTVISLATAWDRDGWDVDEEYFYIKEYLSSSHEVFMVALDSSAAHRTKRAFGKYTGNGSTSGPSVTGLGFQPDSLNICKVSTTASTGYGGISVDVNGVTFVRWLTRESVDDVALGYVATYTPDGFQIINSDNRVNQSGFEYFWWAEYLREP